MRLRLGEQLRRMPLERLRESRAGEMNALLLGNVDEQLNYIVAIANLILTATVAPLALALAVLAFDLRLGALLLAVFPLLWGLHRWRRPAFARDMRGLNDAHWRCHADLVEYTQGLTALRAACQEGGRVGMLHAGFERLRPDPDCGSSSRRSPVGGHRQPGRAGPAGGRRGGDRMGRVGRLQPAAVAAVMVIVVRLSGTDGNPGQLHHGVGDDGGRAGTDRSAAGHSRATGAAAAGHARISSMCVSNRSVSTMPTTRTAPR
ncbi:hypothetical protein NDY24_21260 [Xanthomonas hortorum pv. pelargonii]|nr:hypothetical protein NDY24_21260 [Xanthomonas hortorum pv. pelargonii]